MNRTAAFALAVGLSLVATTADAKHPKPQVGDVSVLTPLDASPGFPENIAIDGNKVYLTGPAQFAFNGGIDASTVTVLDRRTGEVIDLIGIEGEDLSQFHALSGIALDHKGRLYLGHNQLGIVRVDPKTGEQIVYGAMPPDLPACDLVAPGTPCAPEAIFFGDRGPILNDMTFDEAGNLYVADSWQALIWRYAPGGGEPEVWFSDPRFGGFFGPNGIRFDPSRDYVYISTTAPGAIWRLPAGDAPSSADLELVYDYTQSAGFVDGFAVGRDGNLVVAIADPPPASAISILDPEAGVELNRIYSPPDLAIPFDSPAAVAFDGKGSVLIANHAVLTGNPASFAVFDMWVDDKGDRLPAPKLK